MAKIRPFQKRIARLTLSTHIALGAVITFLLVIVVYPELGRLFAILTLAAIGLFTLLTLWMGRLLEKAAKEITDDI